MENVKTCPILKAAGCMLYGRELCNERCALYVETDSNMGCALAVLAAELATKSKTNR